MARLMWQIVSMTYTLTQLAESVAGTVDPDIVKTVSRRIETYTASGLFGCVQVDVGPERLGRGRVRKFPNQAVRWARLWNAFADQGTGTFEIVNATQSLSMVLEGNFVETDWLKDALEGKGPATFLFMEHIPVRTKVSGIYGPYPGPKIQRSPIDLDAASRGGRYINLTAIFSN